MPHQIEVKLKLDVIKEGDYYIIYSPAFQISGYGKTQKNALKDFDETFKLYIGDLVEEGKLLEALLDLGWTLRKTNFKPRHVKRSFSGIKPAGSRTKAVSPKFIKSISKDVTLPVPV